MISDPIRDRAQYPSVYIAQLDFTGKITCAHSECRVIRAKRIHAHACVIYHAILQHQRLS